MPPRGRHRFSSPVRRLLPPLAVAAAAVGCAAAAWAVAGSDAQVLRWLVAGAAAAATAGAVLLRKWDRTASLRLAEAAGSRARAEIRHEEKVSELEDDLEDSRKVRAELEGRLRTRLAELGHLRGEHATLLRRYATAETDRADALEGRRQLAIEAAEPVRALPPANADRNATGAPTPATYLRASVALRHLADNASRQGRGQGQGHESADAGGTGARGGSHFDYFGRKTGGGPPAPRQPEDSADREEDDGVGADTDLADVVGPEILAEVRAEAEEAEAEPEEEPEKPARDDKISKVIDLQAAK
ncbi:hypothetical protein [Streptomyces boninensis]|uniref:hypothetical protein n=1 Tax=Streptomyces boninensis TaxID=2039455 RepID=UPI003B2101DC